MIVFQDRYVFTMGTHTCIWHVKRKINLFENKPCVYMCSVHYCVWFDSFGHLSVQATKKSVFVRFTLKFHNLMRNKNFLLLQHKQSTYITCWRQRQFLDFLHKQNVSCFPCAPHTSRIWPHTRDQMGVLLFQTYIDMRQKFRLDQRRVPNILICFPCKRLSLQRSLNKTTSEMKAPCPIMASFPSF